MPMTRRALAAALVATLAACASTESSSSGLLGDTSRFEARGDGTLVQVSASDEELARYRRVRVDRVLVYLAPDSAGTEIPKELQRDLAGLFQRILTEEFGAHWEMVADLGLMEDDVLRVRAAITDLRPAGSDGGGGEADLASARVEVEILDGPTGDRLAAAVARKVATRPTSSPEEGRAEAERAFRQWAVSLREWLGDMMGK